MALAAPCLTFCLSLSLIASSDLMAGPILTTAQNYMPAIRQELARLDLDVRCDDIAATCVYNKSLNKEGHSFDIVLYYSRHTDTVYIYIDKFIPIADSEGPSLNLARRLLELNREMVTAKFEWDKPTSSIRLSATVNADSNFDRRAFRSQLIGLWAIAKRLWPSLSQASKEKSSSALNAL